MEKIPSACALDWSIEFEVGLRCGQAMEVLEQIGPQLQKLSKEPSVTAGMSKIYGLVREEGRTFANTIILRLADAFRSGDSHIRICIIKVFLQELSSIMKEGRHYKGILMKERVFNNLELLKRIITVYDSGDVEAKALSLRLFGCWCVLTKDCADVHHMILSNLQSTHIRMVKASLFAAGCICRLSSDFAFITLGALVNIICSQVLPAVKVSAARAFGKMQCSYAVIHRAYKAGRKLVQDLLFDDITSEMLLSLTKLAALSISLISEQVDFLLSFLCHECQIIKARVLKCLIFLLSRGCQLVTIEWSSLSSLFQLIDEPHLQMDLHFDALHLLWKVVLCQKNLSSVDMAMLLKLVSIAEKSACSSNSQLSCLAFRLIVDVLCSIKRLSSKFSSTTSPSMLVSSQVSTLVFDGNGLLNLASHVSILVIDKVASAGKLIATVTNELLDLKGKNKECKLLLGLVLKLLEEYPQNFPIVLTHVNSSIEKLVGSFGAADMGGVHHFHHSLIREVCHMSGDVQLAVKKSRLLPESLAPSKKYHSNLASEVVLFLCRFMIACLKVHNISSTATFEVINKIKLFADCIKGSKFINFVQVEVFYVELLSSIMQHQLTIPNCERIGCSKPEVLSDQRDLHWVQCEYLALQFSKMLHKDKNAWALYRAAKCFACEGLWVAATFSFRKLVDCVQLESSTSWLRSLLLLAAAESEAKLLLFPRLGATLFSWLHTDHAFEESWCDINDKLYQASDQSVSLHDCGQSFTRIYDKITSSVQTLSAVESLGNIFYFQRWFLYLRGKTFEVVADINTILSSHSFIQDENNRVTGKEKQRSCPEVLVNDWQNLGTQLCFISCRLNKLAKGYDLLSASFRISDACSSTLAELALGCSLLAFCTSFPFLLTEESLHGQIMHSKFLLDKSTRSLLLQDLVERLWNVDSGSVSNLLKHFTVSSECKLYQQSPAQLQTSSLSKDILRICRLSISLICTLYKTSIEVQGNTWILDGMQVMLNILKEWVKLPFKIPTHFFKTRPCMSAELFMHTADFGMSSSVSVIPGMKLSLDLCFQLKNIPTWTSNISKVHCLVATSPSHCVSDSKQKMEKHNIFSCNSLDSGLLVELHENLLLLMKEENKVSIMNQSLGTARSDWIVTYLGFELNDCGQGFTTCLLDVSFFPEGIYQMYWHSCIVDEDGSFLTLQCLNTIFFNIHNDLI